MTRLLVVSFVCLFVAHVGLAAETKAAKVTVTVRGVVTADDAQAVRRAIEKVAGAKLKPDDLQPGEKGPFGHYFTSPFVIELTDCETADIGAVAKAVARSPTSQSKELPPSLNLVLYMPTLQVQEGHVSDVRNAVKDVNGIDALAPGGVGGIPAEGRFWVRLDREGQARLADVLAALRKADLNLKLEKP